MRKTRVLLVGIVITLLFGTRVFAETQKTDCFFAEELQEELVSAMEIGQVQEMMDEMLGENSFSLLDAWKKLMTGEGFVSKEAFGQLLKRLFLSGAEKERSIFFRILLLVFMGAVFTNFVDVFDNGQIGAVSFYTVYLMLFTILMEKFSVLGKTISDCLMKLTGFMETLSPVYFMAVAVSSGASTATVFHEAVLLLVWVIQWLLITVLLPAINLYILLKLVNHLSKEEMLSKMAELLDTAVSWGLKTMLGTVAGLQAVKGLLAPVMDTLKRSVLGKTASAIPGIGNAVNVVTELVLTSAVLVRNSFGAVVLFVLLLIGLKPVIHLCMLSLSYRFLAALSQPVSDKRIVGALGTFAEGCTMLLRILIAAETLCMLAFLVLMSGGAG